MIVAISYTLLVVCYLRFWFKENTSGACTNTGTHLSEALDLLPPDGGVIDRAHLHASCEGNVHKV